MSPAARITSASSDRVKAVRALHSRQGRRKAGRFLVEGPQAVRAALVAATTTDASDAAGVVIRDLFMDDDAGSVMSDLVSAAERAGIPVTPVSPAVLAAMAETAHPQGVVAVCDLLPEPSLVELMSRPGPVVVLEAVSDPGNVGTVIRTADAAGAAGVVLTPGSADVHGGKVVRSTAGSLFHLPVATGVELADLAAAAAGQGRRIAVATGDADLDLFAAVAAGAVDGRTCWLVGSEAHGVSGAARAIADLAVRIPMAGRAESLNAAIAAAVVVYVTAHEEARSADSGHPRQG